MKILILFICLLNVPIFFGQKGFKKIHKAEKLIQRNKLNRAMKLLCQADSMDYGFCGNAIIAAQNDISFYKAEIYYRKKDYKNALATMSNFEFGFTNINYDERDSLLVLYAIGLYGKEKVKQDLDSALIQMKKFDFFEFYKVTNLKVAFLDKALTVDLESLRKNIVDTNKTDTEKLELVKNHIREKAFYKLLLN